MYENRITKTVLKGEIRKNNRRVNLIKVHYMYVWKYHNGTPLYNEYMIMRVREKRERLLKKLPNVSRHKNF
jgi:expansin (peptidoglycan-binding protein)